LKLLLEVVRQRTCASQAEYGRPSSRAKANICLEADAIMVTQEKVAMRMTIAVKKLVAGSDCVTL
jgi:hypothetical protein